MISTELYNLLAYSSEIFPEEYVAEMQEEVKLYEASVQAEIDKFVEHYQELEQEELIAIMTNN